MSTRTEIKSLTSLRGIAALLVVLYHLRKEFGTALDWDRFTGFAAYGWIWVDFFFILSGFVMMYVYGDMFDRSVRPRSYAAFMMRRLARVYPLHIVMLICFIPTELAKFVVPSDAYPAFSVNSVPAIFTNALLIQSWHVHTSATWNQPAWSISAEFAAYLLFPFVPAALHQLRARGLLALIAACLLTELLFVRTIGGGSLNHSYDFGVPRCLPTFVIGAALCRIYQGPDNPLKRILARDSAAWIAMAVAVVLLHVNADSVLVLVSFTALIAAAAMNRGSFDRAMSLRPIYWLGTISYSIYMTQALVIRVWQFVFGAVFHHSMGTPMAVAVLLALIAIILATSTLTYRTVETAGRRYLNAVAARIGAGDANRTARLGVPVS